VDRQISQTELRGFVLDVLARREAYGVEIAAALAAHMAATDASDFPEGAIYPALRWLERHGLAMTHWVDVGEAAPRRRYYSLTPKGARVAARDGLGKAQPEPRPSMSAARS
jgi:PadR family transcriptional regulator PadR